MEVTGCNGAHDRQLVGGVAGAEDVQRPVAHGRASLVWMAEADPVVCKERHRGQSSFLLFGPNEVPRRTHTTISITLQAGRDDLASVKQQVSVDLVECLTSNWRQ